MFCNLWCPSPRACAACMVVGCNNCMTCYCLAACESQPQSHAREVAAGTRCRCRNCAKPIFSVRIFMILLMSFLHWLDLHVKLASLFSTVGLLVPQWGYGREISISCASHEACHLLAKCFQINSSFCRCRILWGFNCSTYYPPSSIQGKVR